jgi:hypothetical protein
MIWHTYYTKNKEGNKTPHEGEIFIIDLYKQKRLAIALIFFVGDYFN